MDNVYKKERVRCKLENYNNRKNKERRTNKRTEAHTTDLPPPKRAMLTPLIEGKVQFGLLQKDSHFTLIKEELVDHNIPFPQDILWSKCLALLKEDEKDQKFFFPKKNHTKITRMTII